MAVCCVVCSGTKGDPFVSSVQILADFENPTGPTTYTPNVGGAVSFSGAITDVSGVSKFGSYALKTNGVVVGSCTLNPKTAGIGLPGDFTAECWVYPISLASDSYFMYASAPDNWALMFRDGNILSLFIDGIAAYYSGALTVPLNAWSHVVTQRKSGIMQVFLNGALDISVADAHAYTNAICVLGQPAARWNGYIDEFRLTVGVARYTAPFTPPSSPF